MKRASHILVTGATGNVGRNLLSRLLATTAQVSVGVRNIELAKAALPPGRQAYCLLDFERAVYPSSDFDAVFLIRPPQLTDEKLFEHFLAWFDKNTKIVFLSVQGADRRRYLPHAKIEAVICRLGLERTFVRPAYFMENLTTTLWDELLNRHRVCLPASNLAFDWVSVADVAEISAISLLCDSERREIDVCSVRLLGFQAVVETINGICGTNIRYESPSLLAYLLYALRQRMPVGQVFVMLLLHYFPRFGSQKAACSNDFLKITGRNPMTIEEFVLANNERFQALNKAS